MLKFRVNLMLRKSRLKIQSVTLNEFGKRKCHGMNLSLTFLAQRDSIPGYYAQLSNISGDRKRRTTAQAKKK